MAYGPVLGQHLDQADEDILRPQAAADLAEGSRIITVIGSPAMAVLAIASVFLRGLSLMQMNKN
jgi:hypothetical protein